MSGITGIFNLDGAPVSTEELHAATRALRHRGPDGVSHWLHGPIGFVHLAFHTTPEAPQVQQPVFIESAELCITFDGRIDNRAELTRQLHSRGLGPSTSDDPELVLQAYRCWGEECPAKLLGDFAFAIWDGRHRQLFCARDHIGVKPFYYHRSAKLFAFSSESGALLALSAISRRLNESRIVDYLVTELDRDDPSSTFYADILRLPAGHCLTITSDGARLRNYWNLQPPPTLKLRSVEECGEAFRQIFQEAIRCRLPSIHPLGSTLSGGIDSSSVVCTIRARLNAHMAQPLHTFSLVDVNRDKCTETPYIEEVLRAGGLVPHVIRSDAPSPYLPDLQQAVASADEPFETAQYWFEKITFEAAARNNVRVLLDGVDGDLITPHLCYLSSLLRGLEWRALAHELSYLAREHGLSPWRTLLSRAVVPFLPNAYYLFNRVRNYQPNIPNSSLIDPDFARRMQMKERLAEHQCRIWRAARDAQSLHALSFTSAVLPFAFEYFNRIAAHTGIETRHPFADRRIIELFLALPVTMKMHTPIPKLILRAGMADILPEKVRWRREYGHPGPAFLASLLRQHAEVVEETLRKSLHYLCPYVNVRKAQAEYASFSSSGPYSAWQVWQVTNLGLWLLQRG